MIRNLFCYDSDFLTGRRLQRNLYSGHQKNSDRPQHLSNVSSKKCTNQFSYTKVLQKKCFDNTNQVKFTFFNKSKHSRLTLEPNLDILNNRSNNQCKINLGIFSNAKSTDVQIISKDKPMSKKNGSIKKLTTKIEPVYEFKSKFENFISNNKDNHLNNVEDIAHVTMNDDDQDDATISNSQSSLKYLDQSLPPKIMDTTNESILFDFDNDDSISLNLISNNETIQRVPSTLQTNCVHDKDIFTEIYIQRYKDEYFQCPESTNKKRIQEISQHLF